MSIPFLPGIKIQAGRPHLNIPMSVSRYGNRAISFVQSSDSFWTVDVETWPMDEAKLADFEAWLARTRGGMETVVFTPRHVGSVPRAYWSDPANPILDDTGDLVSVTNGKQINLNSITASLAITAGDLVSLKTGDFVSLHRVTTGAVAASTSMSLAVEPPVPSYIAAGATVIFKNPPLNTRLLPSSVEIGDGLFPTARFQLMEVPR
ncbi:hypothetical protein A6R70_14375 [Agrobacterium rubi]|uniref:hypothetical protein n=1 Tax=Agrobacterium rubi TaxID=28099 RepID=UPI00201B82BA|nr:hypothetical protein [Agrobacterium rubi]MCL6653475.1 hypothetical protein [Agrobacterium rubi]